MTDTLVAPVAIEAPKSEADLLAPVYVLPRLELAAGKGARVTGADGRVYLDFVSGIAVNALGHAHPGIARLVARQAKQLVHTSNLFGHEPGAALARALTDATGYARVFFCNSGTEGIEAALKFARARAGKLGLPGRDIVAFQGGFHGRTAFSLAATWTPAYREPFEPLVPGVRFAPFNDIAGLEQVFDRKVAAVIVEPVQGESGAVPARKDFLEAVVAKARAVGAAVVLDEVQTGMGRTGELLAQQHYGIRGDYTVLSKALGGGLPLGAVLMTEDAAATLAPGMHGCTFGGGPLVTSVGGYVLGVVNTPAFLQRVRSRAGSLSRALKALVKRHRSLAGERGLGLLRAIEVAADAGFDAPALIRAAREQGLLLVRGGERAVRLLPPLNVSPKEITEAIEALDRALTHLETTPTGESK
jgi:acetylornithine/N-succinyldiaminopimelate aminotransferase